MSGVLVRIVVPTRGPSVDLDALLSDLARELRRPSSPICEVFVATSDAVTDWTPALRGEGEAIEYADRAALQGAGINRNRGAAGTTAPWLVFLDDDVRLPDGYLLDLATVLSDPAVPDLVGGGVRSQRPRNWFSQAAEDFVVRHKQYPEGWYLVAAHLIVRRPAFESLGGFDESMVRAGGEDWDLCRRAHGLGLRIGTTSAVLVNHRNPTTWNELVDRAKAYGAGGAALDERAQTESGHVAHSNAARFPAWFRQEYRTLRGSGRSPIRAARSTLIQIPWMTEYLRAQREATRTVSHTSAL